MPAAAQERHQRKKESLPQECAPALEAEIDRFIAPAAADGIDIEAFELHVRHQALRLAARAVERRLNADLSDGGQRPRECRCCGRQARCVGRFPKTLETVLGPLTLERFYYPCRTCGAGFCPRDNSLGLQGASLSPRRSAARSQLPRARPCSTASPLPRPPCTSASTASTCRCAPRRWPATPASTREAKLIVIRTAEQRDEDGCAVCGAGSTTYSAAVDSAASRDSDPERSAFARRVWREAERRGFPQVSRRVILGDCAKWIWRQAYELFPGAIQIVDFFHAAERLWGVGKVLLRDDRAAAEMWAEARCSELRKGRLDTLLATLKAHAASARRPQNARPTSRRTASACATRTSAHKACRSVPGLWRQAARQSSPCGSSRPACTGPRTGRRASWHCALASSAGGTKTSGHGARNPSTQLRPDRDRPDPPYAVPRLTVPHLARILNGGLSIGPAHSLQTCVTARKPARIRIVSCTQRPNAAPPIENSRTGLGAYQITE